MAAAIVGLYLAFVSFVAGHFFVIMPCLFFVCLFLLIHLDWLYFDDDREV